MSPSMVAVSRTVMRTVAAGGYSGSDTPVGVTLWDTGTAQVKHQLRMRWVWCVAFSLDSATVATGSDGGIGKLWDVASGEERLQLRGHTTTVKAVTFSPDGKTLATGSADQTIKLWDVVTSEERATHVGHTDWVGALAFAPDRLTRGFAPARSSRQKRVKFCRSSSIPRLRICAL